MLQMALLSSGLHPNSGSAGCITDNVCIRLGVNSGELSMSKDHSLDVDVDVDAVMEMGESPLDARSSEDRLTSAAVFFASAADACRNRSAS